MFMRVKKLGMLAILGMIVCAAPASAVTLVPNDGTVALAIGNNYNYATFAPALGGGAVINDTFYFTAAPGLTTLTTPIVLNSGGTTQGNFGVSNLTIKWFSGANLVPIASLVFSTASGFVTNPFAAIALTLTAGGAYHVLVTGTALSGGGIYSINIATTPLPPALLLFGTGLAGLTWLGRRRRRTAKLAL